MFKLLLRICSLKIFPCVPLTISLYLSKTRAIPALVMDDFFLPKEETKKQGRILAALLEPAPFFFYFYFFCILIKSTWARWILTSFIFIWISVISDTSSPTTRVPVVRITCRACFLCKKIQLLSEKSCIHWLVTIHTASTTPTFQL